MRYSYALMDGIFLNALAKWPGKIPLPFTDVPGFQLRVGEQLLRTLDANLVEQIVEAFFQMAVE